MTEQEIRSKVVSTAKQYIGYKESDGTHRKIIDTYNAQKPLPVGYKVKYTDAWCATFVSFVGIKSGFTDIMFPECSCPRMVELYKKAGRWKESDAHVPANGDIVMYDWQDSGVGDNTGTPDHVGIVVAICGNTMKIIEGNISNAVGYRTLNVNGKYIRGYCLPDYASKATKSSGGAKGNSAKPSAAVTSYKPTVLEWQKAAIADGFQFPKYGADGAWGSECLSVAKRAIVKKRANYQYPNLTKIVQKVVGVDVDGKCGKDTNAAIRAYQEANGLTVDGAVGANTWKKMLGVK